MLYVIGNKNFSVTVDSFGAQLNSIKLNLKEKLWQNEDGSWDGHAPFLFPNCGTFTLKSDGVSYSTIQHGFVKNKEFSAVKQTETELWLNTKYDNDTLKVYPFKFSLTIKFSVVKSELSIITEVENLGDDTLYFATGGHESYALDGDLQDYYVEFQKTEKLLRLFHNDKGVLTGKTVVYPESRFLKFTEIPIVGNETLIFKDIRSRWCKLVKNNGEVIAKTFFDGIKNLLFWKTEFGRFVCIEPWMNLPDTENVSPQDISQTQGFIAVSAGEKHAITRKIIYYR